MKFSCNVNNLSDAYSYISKIAGGQKDTVYSQIHMALDGGILTMSARNAMGEGNVVISVAQYEAGSCCLEADVLSKALRKSAAAFNTFEFNLYDTSLNMGLCDGNGLENNRSQTVSTKDPNLYLSMFRRDLPSKLNMTLNGRIFKTALDMVTPIIENEGKYNYILLELDVPNKLLRIIGTNGSHMSRVEISAEQFSMDNVNCNVMTIPMASCDLLFNALSSCQEESLVEISYNDSTINVNYPDEHAQFTTPLYDVVPFNWGRAYNIMSGECKTLEIPLSVFNDALSGVINEDKTVQVIHIDSDSTTASMTSGNSVRSEKITFPASELSEGFKFIVNVPRTQKALSGIKKDTKLTLCRWGESAAMVTPSLNEKLAYIQHFSQVWAPITED